jgi:hypothetical protein
MIYTFQVTQKPEIDCRVSCDVVIATTDSGSVQVEVSGSDRFIEKCRVTQHGNTIKIDAEEEDLGGSSTTIINGVVMQSSGGSVISVGGAGGMTVVSGSGSVVINGKRINLDTLDDAPSEPKPVITIYTPLAVFECNLSGVSSLNSTAVLANVFLQCKGHCEASLLSVESLDVNISGSGRVNAELKGGELATQISGSGQLHASGEWSKANVQISGSGQVYTNGVCNGDYRASVSGSGYVSHQGEVKGRIRENVSGSGRIDI